MANKGFVIDDLLSDVRAKRIIPAFKHSAPCISEDTEKTQAIACLRKVARAIMGQIKSNQIWDSPIPLTLIGTVSQMWPKCCVMVSFQGPQSCEEHFAHTVGNGYKISVKYFLNISDLILWDLHSFFTVYI
uniref:Si:dkey-231p15.1 n=2 Tax=Nothobranchius kadleci TaxID=1051664 RepID=A0A1A8CH57_NOTKA